MNKHTPGTWQRFGHLVFVLNKRDYNRVSFRVEGGYDDNDNRISNEEISATAQLAQAAPDMLSLIEKYREALLDGPSNLSWARAEELEEEADAVITKAKGKV